MVNPLLQTPPPTPRIAFRRLQLSDESLMNLLNHDKDVMKYLNHFPPEEGEVRDEVASILASYVRWPRFGRWIALCRASGQFLGWFALAVSGSNPLTLELGYRLRCQFWGTGLATEGSKTLLRYAFEQEDVVVERVFGQTMFVNYQSRRVMEKCGMGLERTFHLHFDDPLPGTELGEVEYGISRETWEHQHKVHILDTSRS
ncbi:hypothetical protein LOZ53_001382 [Ophidiomyces ophidiicola]|nr:hypothetical protein LOZ53_001382 [Ophidiomyces ophidiicola]